MVKKALFVKTEDNNCDLEPLIERCRQEKFEVEDYKQPQEHEALRKLLPSTPALLFMPAVEEDCWGVKLAQDAFVEKLPRVIILYASSMPSREFLCLAFREGVDDVITLDSDEETLNSKIKRANNVLQTRLELAGFGGSEQQKIKSLQLQCEKLERKTAKWEERLLALASTATRMATGQLSLAENAPSVLIVATSNSQASSVAELCRHLGFDSHVTHTGKEALELIAKEKPNVILTDGTLPDMNATAFAPAARKALGKEPVVIIAWSSSPEVEDTLLAPDSGIDDFVLKSTSSEGTGLLTAALLGGLR
ncbi:MAG: response regulator [Sedimentisphaerales bacterium]|nr:response regulator [Sedimentisphaerales bacterium]